MQFFEELVGLGDDRPGDGIGRRLVALGQSQGRGLSTKLGLLFEFEGFGQSPQPIFGLLAQTFVGDQMNPRIAAVAEEVPVGGSPVFQPEIPPTELFPSTVPEKLRSESALLNDRPITPPTSSTPVTSPPTTVILLIVEDARTLLTRLPAPLLLPTIVGLIKVRSCIVPPVVRANSAAP